MMLNQLKQMDSRLDSFLGANAMRRVIEMRNDTPGLKYYDQKKFREMDLPYTLHLIITGDGICTITGNGQRLMSGNLTYSIDVFGANRNDDVSSVVQSLIFSQCRGFRIEIYDQTSTFIVSSTDGDIPVTKWHGTFQYT
jgi:hypothetical protein